MDHAGETGNKRLDEPTLVDTRFAREQGFLVREGPAKKRGESPSQKKLCFTATSVDAMARVLYYLSLRQDCWLVKLDAAVKPNGMVRGRCFLTSAEAIGKVWQHYKVTEDVLCTVQDDYFTKAFR